MLESPMCWKKKKAKTAFIESMLLRTEKLPDSPGFVNELKFDGYRALAMNTAERFSYDRESINVPQEMGPKPGKHHPEAAGKKSGSGT